MQHICVRLGYRFGAEGSLWCILGLIDSYAILGSYIADGGP